MARDVLIRLKKLSTTGKVPANAAVRFEPTVLRADADGYILDDYFDAVMVDGEATVTDLPETDLNWAYKVQIRGHGRGAGLKQVYATWYVHLPAGTGTVNFEDLPRIDPKTLTPVNDPDPAWVDAVTAVFNDSVSTAVEPAMVTAVDDETSQFRSRLNAATVQTLTENESIVQAAAEAVARQPDGALTYNTVMRDRGEYDAGLSYSGGDVVTHDGGRFYAAAGEGTTTQVRTNHLPNPRFANNRAGWTVTTGVTGTVEGTGLRLDLTADKTATNSLLLGPEIATAETEIWSASALVTVPAGASAPVEVRLNVSYYPTPAATPAFALETIQPGESKVIKVEGSVVPSGKTTVRGILLAGTATLPTGTSLTVSEPIMEKAPTIGAYFDGATPDTATEDYAWTGTVDNSASTRTATVALSPTFGVPGEDSKWVKVSEAGGSVDPGEVNDLIVHRASGYSALVPSHIEIEDTRPLGYLGGVFYGTFTGGGYIRKSYDQGRTWTNVQNTGLAEVVSLLDAGDGEVLVGTATGVYKSTGWSTDEATATFREVLHAPEPSKFHAYGLDAVPATGRCFATTYSNNANGPDWSNSRYGWLSTDHGDTWTVVWDKNTRLSDPGLATKSHNHLAAIDPWANGRLWISWHTDGTPKEHEVCYSDDDGATWTAITSNHQPQTGAAAKHGMVFGSDDAENGIHVVERTANPADMRYVWAWEWRNSKPGFLVGHANRSFRDEATGNVYTGFMVSITGDVATSTIAESNGRAAWGVWEHPAPFHSQSGEGIRGRLVSGDGVVLAHLWNGEDVRNETVVIGRRDQTLTAPDGTRYQLTVDNTGTLTTTPA